MLNTEEIMQIALELVGFREIPADSGIYNPGEGIERVLFGIDIGPAELYIAKELGYDAVIAHHPSAGVVSLNSWKVFLRHIDFMIAAGVPEDKARKAGEERVEMMKITAQRSNYDHNSSVARLLNMPFLNIHCPLDEMGRKRMQEKIDATLAEDSSATLKDIISALNEFGEFKNAKTKIELLVGDEMNRAGKTVVAHGALTNGGYPVANTYFENGVDTVIYIHIGEDDYRRLKEEKKGNLIVTGHIASDCLGINPFLKALEDRGLEVAKLGVIEP